MSLKVGGLYAIIHIHGLLEIKCIRVTILCYNYSQECINTLLKNLCMYKVPYSFFTCNKK